MPGVPNTTTPHWSVFLPLYICGETELGDVRFKGSRLTRRTISWILSLTYCRPRSRFVISMVTMPSAEGTSTVLVLAIDGERSTTNTVAVYWRNQ